MSHSRPFSFALILTLALFGCRGSGGGNGGDDPDGGGGGGEDDTVFDVQDPANEMAVGTSVTLRGVVVVAVDTYGGRTGGLYVMEPEGGPYSGVFVFAPGATVSPGDLVDIEGGVKDEFGLEDSCDRDSDCTVTEISPPEGGSVSVTSVGSGSIPEPQVLLPQDLAADDTEAEKWEGVFIEFENVRVFEDPYGVDDDDSTLLSMDVTGPFNVQSALTEFSGISEGDCYGSIAGVGHYIFDYRLYPRESGDLGSGGDSCLDPEEGDTLCGDGMDNDFDGTMDCDGRSCFTAQTACPSEDTTVVAVQDGTVEEDTLVELTDVAVTARSFDGDTLWVQDDEDDADAGPHNGVQIYLGPGQEFDEAIVEGTRISVIGMTEEFDFDMDSDDSLTQVRDVVVVDSTPGAASVEILTETLATALGEEYEGVLVNLEGVSVTAVDSDADQFTISQGGESVVVDDEVFRYEDAAMEDCIADLTGVMHYNSFDDIIVVLPRSADDIDEDGTGAACAL